MRLQATALCVLMCTTPLAAAHTVGTTHRLPEWRPQLTPATAPSARLKSALPLQPNDGTGTHQRCWNSAHGLLRLNGGARAATPTASAVVDSKAEVPPAEDSSLQLTLHDGVLAVRGMALLEGVSATLRSSPTVSGGVFIYADCRPARATLSTSLGKLQCTRLLACARINRYWMSPAWGSSAEDVPFETQFLLTELSTTPGATTTPSSSSAAATAYALLLPLTDRTARATLRGARRNLELQIETGDEDTAVPDNTRALYVAAGTDPFELVQRGMREVSEQLGTFRTLSQKTLPPSVDFFGWCTWDAFYSSVTPQGVCDGLRSLRAAGVPPRNLVLDDGWQSVEPEAQQSFGPSGEVQQSLGPSAGGEAHNPPVSSHDDAPLSQQLQQPREPEQVETQQAAKSLASPSDPPLKPQPRTSQSNLPALSSLSANDPALVEEGQAASVISATELTTSRSPSPLTYAAAAVMGALRGWLARVVALVASVFTKGLEAFYNRYVADAAHGTWANVIWAALTRSVLKGALENYFEESTDFARQLSSFAPNSKFESESRSLADLVRVAKSDLGVRHVYVWHALHGYWRGLGPSLATTLPVEQVLPRPSRNLLRLEPRLRWDPTILFGAGLLMSPEALAEFYVRLHSPLVAAGVDGLKVDVQSGLAALGGGMGGGVRLTANYVRALEDSVKTRFGSNLIHCMSHSTENLYQYSHGSVVRASDDFYPNRPETQTTHLVNVAYNSLFLGEIALPDWDMFTSRNEAASLHAAARAVGGCPVYVSDAPAQHDAELLRRLVLPDGTVLRAKLPGRPTRDALFANCGADGRSALKVWNVNSAMGAVVGAFNVQGSSWNFRRRRQERMPGSAPTISTQVRPSDAEHLRRHSGGVAAWCHRGGQLTLLPNIDAAIELTLRPKQWEIVSFSPVRTLGRVRWAPIGLVDMLNSGGGVLETSLHAAPDADRGDGDGDGDRGGHIDGDGGDGDGDGDRGGHIDGDGGDGDGDGDGGGSICARLLCRCPGTFVAFCRPAPATVVVNGGSRLRSFHYMPSTGQLTIMLAKAEDVLQASAARSGGGGSGGGSGEGAEGGESVGRSAQVLVTWPDARKGD